MNIAEKKEEILAVCRTAKKIVKGSFGMGEPVGCGCPLTLFAESLGWTRINTNVRSYLEGLGYEYILCFTSGFDGRNDTEGSAYHAGKGVYATLCREGITVTEII